MASNDRGKSGFEATLQKYKWLAWISDRKEWLLLGLIILLATGLRIYNLGTESLWLDETASISESKLSITGMVNATNRPPLYPILLNQWIHIFGTSEIALRSMSVVFGIIAIFFIYLTAKVLANRKIAFTSALFAAISYYLIYYSQEARDYSLLVLLSLLSFYSFIQILKTNKFGYYIAYLSFGIFMIYTHVFGLLTLVSQVLYLLLFQNRYKEQRFSLFVTIGMVIVLFVPAAFLLKDRIHDIATGGFILGKPNMMSILDTLSSYSGTGDGKYVLILVFVAAGVFWIIDTIYKKKNQQNKENQPTPTKSGSGEMIVLLIIWLFVPIMLTFLESQVMTPLYNSKYLISSTPAFYILAAIAFSSIRWNKMYYIALLVIVVLSFMGLKSYYETDVKQQWREVALYIGSNATDEDLVIFCPSYIHPAFDYYYKGDLKRGGPNQGESLISCIDRNLVTVKGTQWVVFHDYRKCQEVLTHYTETVETNMLVDKKIFKGVYIVILKDQRYPGN
jgi:mannosyltransferase